jgi:hypothetical protein
LSEALVRRLATADADTRGAALARLQQSAGNAGVARMLLRAEADPLDRDPPPGPGIEPHPPGQDADTATVLAEADKGAEGELVLDEAESADRAAPPPATAAFTEWEGRQVSTNPEYAQWLLDGGTHGFVTFNWNSKQQLESYAAGREHSMTGTYAGQTEIGGTIDPRGATILPVLETARGIVAARAGRWMQDRTKPKQPLTILWLARNWPGGDAHRAGKSLDAAGGIDFGNARAGAQVIQILEDLPPGNYWIGLPYQRPFFDVIDSLLHYTNDAERTARATGAQPADVTVQGLVEWKLVGYTAKWNPRTREWDKTPGSMSATTKIQDAALRAALAGGNGKTFSTFPDRPDHIHIQRV